MSDALQRIALLASSLSQAELRLLLELAVRAEVLGAIRVTASSRDLAQTTGLARASVQAAIDSLNSRQLIRSDAGSPTQPAVHFLICLDSESMASGLVAEPLVAQSLSHGGLTTGPGVAQPVSHRGLMVEPEVAQAAGHPRLVSEPPRDEKSVIYAERIKERAGVRADSIDFDFDKNIDRLQKARKANFDESLFETARMQIASHHAKYARLENRLPGLPDDVITAQFLAIAEWPRLEALLSDLAAERKEAGYSYGWYVTVALQRIHGLSPAHVREMRARFKASVKSTVSVAAPAGGGAVRSSNSFRKPSGREQSSGLEQHADTEQLKQQIRAVATARSMR